MGHTILKNLITYLIIVSVFATGEGFSGLGFNIYWYYPFYLAFLAYGFLVVRKINIKLLSVFIVLTLFSLSTYDSGVSLVVKQLLNIGLTGLVFYFLLSLWDFDLPTFFRKYITVAKVVIIIGFAQVALYHLGLDNWYIFVFRYLNPDNTTFRLQSITQEPASIAFTLAPVVFLSVQNLFYGRRYLMTRTWSILFVLAYLLTLSSVAYVGFVIMLFTLYFKTLTSRKVKLVFVAVSGIVIFSFVAYRSISFIRTRVDDTLYALSKDFSQGNTYRDVNISTYALLSNFYVTKKGVAESPYFGNGLGTYELVYDRHLPSRMKEYFMLNNQDANSLALRLAAETGLIGLFLFLIFVFAFRIKGRIFQLPEADFLWIVNSGVLVFILLSLLRSGNYTYHGRILFLMVYYFSYKQIHRISSQPDQTVTETNV